jgi:hypothetical protein
MLKSITKALASRKKKESCFNRRRKYELVRGNAYAAIGVPPAGMVAVTNTATVTFSGYLSMASARLCPPKLWATRTAFWPSGSAATAPSSDPAVLLEGCHLLTGHVQRRNAVAGGHQSGGHPVLGRVGPRSDRPRQRVPPHVDRRFALAGQQGQGLRTSQEQLASETTGGDAICPRRWWRGGPTLQFVNFDARLPLVSTKMFVLLIFHINFNYLSY